MGEDCEDEECIYCEQNYRMEAFNQLWFVSYCTTGLVYNVLNVDTYN